MAFWLSVPQLGVRALGGVFTEERYEVWPPNMGRSPPACAGPVGMTTPRPAIDFRGFLDGVPGSAIRAASLGAVHNDRARVDFGVRLKT